MAVPGGTVQRAVLVAIPLGLIASIFATAAFFPPEGQPGPPDVPYLLVQVTTQEWNATVNETGLVYVRSPLGVPIYEYLAVNVSGVENGTDLTDACGGTASRSDGNWTCESTLVPSTWIKLPVVDASAVNVSAVAIWEGRTFGYNVTVLFLWDEAGWILRVWPDRDVEANHEDARGIYQAPMRLEAEG